MEALLDLLLNQEKTLDIIQNLSIYVIYFYPGTISLYVMNFLEAKSLKEDTAYVVKIFAVSYLYNLALGRLRMLSAATIREQYNCNSYFFYNATVGIQNKIFKVVF